MVDRLEELLALLEEEDENEEEREDVPALKDRTVPIRTPGEDGGSDIADEPAWRPDGKATWVMGGPGGAEEREDGGSDIVTELAAELAWRLDGKAAWETGGPGDIEELADGLAWRLDGKTAWETGGPGGAEERKGGPDMVEKLSDGLAWRLSSRAAQEVEAVWRQELLERLDQIDGAAAEAVHPAAKQAAQAVGESMRLEQERDGELAWAVGRRTGSGLENLYRQTVQASRPAPQAVSVEQAGRTFHAEEPGRTAALTVDELDRAVRRDSRRYDGGMMIF